jgi:hypothetical protein
MLHFPFTEPALRAFRTEGFSMTDYRSSLLRRDIPSLSVIPSPSVILRSHRPKNLLAQDKSEGAKRPKNLVQDKPERRKNLNEISIQNKV